MNAISNRKKAHIVLLILTFVATACMELGFRKYLFNHLGNHSILAGSIPNFMAVVLATLIYVVLKGENENPLKLSAIGSSMMVLYEFVQPLIQGRTFDVFDIAASLMGGLFVFGLLSTVDYFIKPPAQKKEKL
ncbi:hypothetical protein [Pedobacter sp. UBA5917]|jgi:membrane protease YdiL (CAAX protease family)|uniref:hypothetical protein n=1 Tax=Pedobacter sp. UBA5917 TaxID=1947061 RepID=UPI0025D9A389|nr:hypothetical protein [Pedobacter sp. UBA5917]